MHLLTIDDKKQNASDLIPLLKFKTVVVMLHKPNCYWCSQLKPVWNEFKEKMKKKHNDDMAIVDIDITTPIDMNSNLKTNSVPTIRLLDKGNLVSEFNMDRTTDNLIEWVAKNTKPNIKLTVTNNASSKMSGKISSKISSKISGNRHLLPRNMSNWPQLNQTSEKRKSSNRYSSMRNTLMQDTSLRNGSMRNNAKTIRKKTQRKATKPTKAQAKPTKTQAKPTKAQAKPTKAQANRKKTQANRKKANNKR